MDIAVEITGSLARRLTVVVPAIELNNAIQKRIQKLTKTAKLDGFRPGKIPEKIIKLRFGEAIRGEAIEEVLQTSLRTALEKEELKPAEPPMIQSLEADDGKPVKYSATFEVYPSIQMASLADVTLEKTVVNIEDFDLEHVLEQMRKQHIIWEEVQRPAQVGDKLTVDIIRSAAGQPQADSEQKGVALILEEGKIPASFNEKLLGANAGDVIIIDLPEPKDSQTTIKINKIEAPILPVLDDEFAKKLSIETVADLRTQVREHMEQELNIVLKNKLKTQLLDKLFEKNPVELPKALVEKEQQHLEQEWQERLRQNTNKADMTLSPESKERSLVTARRRVTLKLLFAEIIKQHNIQVDIQRVQQQVMRIASSFQDPQAIINMIRQQPIILNDIRSQVMEEQVVELLLEQVQYTEKTTKYHKVMQLSSGADSAFKHEHQHDEDHMCEHQHEHSA